MGFPGGSDGKESTFNVGDLGWIPGLGRSSGEGQATHSSSWAFLVAQLVKNPPAMWETWVGSLGWEYPLEKGKATPFQYFGLMNSMDCVVQEVTKSWR